MNVDEVITPEAFKRKVVYRCYKLNNYYIQQYKEGKLAEKDMKEKLRLTRCVISDVNRC